MSPEEFEQQLKVKQTALKNYVNNVFPTRAGDISIRFINGNFNAEGWQGKSFEPWKAIKRKGKILTKSGVLRRGTTFTASPGQAHVFNNVPYAAVHNNGFNGTVQIPAHERRIMEAKKVPLSFGRAILSGRRTKTIHTVKSISTVKAHTRKMNIAKRQYMPTDMYNTPVLYESIRREIINNGFKKIFE